MTKIQTDMQTEPISPAPCFMYCLSDLFVPSSSNVMQFIICHRHRHCPHPSGTGPA